MEGTHEHAHVHEHDHTHTHKHEHAHPGGERHTPNTPTSTPMIISMNTNMSTGIVVIRTCTTMITPGTTDLTIMTIPDMMRKFMIINN